MRGRLLLQGLCVRRSSNPFPSKPLACTAGLALQSLALQAATHPRANLQRWCRILGHAVSRCHCSLLLSLSRHLDAQRRCGHRLLSLSQGRTDSRWPRRMVGKGSSSLSFLLIERSGSGGRNAYCQAYFFAFIFMHGAVWLRGRWSGGSGAATRYVIDGRFGVPRL